MNSRPAPSTGTPSSFTVPVTLASLGPVFWVQPRARADNIIRAILRFILKRLVQTAVAAKESLIETEAGAGQESRVCRSCVLRVFSQKADGAVAPGELCTAGMKTVEALALRLIAGVARDIHGAFAGALEGKNIVPLGRGIGRPPTAVPDAIPITAAAGLLRRV